MRLDLGLDTQISGKFLIELESYLNQIQFGKGVISIGAFILGLLMQKILAKSLSTMNSHSVSAPRAYSQFT